MRPSRYAAALLSAISFLWAGPGLCDGQIDHTWAGDGRIALAGDFLNPANGSEAHRVTLQANGNLLLGGLVFGPGMNLYWWLGELTPHGTPVPTFGQADGSGRVTGCWLSPTLCSGHPGSSRVLQGDGRIVVVSGTAVSRTTAGAHALDVMGVVGGTGIASLLLTMNDAGGQMVSGHAIAGLPSGKWIVAGTGRYSAMDPDTGIAVVRVNQDFSLDPMFNAATDGNGISFFGGQLVAIPGMDHASAFSVVVQDDGRILLHGTASSTLGGPTVGAMARLHADGSLDNGFGVGGIATFPQCGFFGNTVHMDRAGRTISACIGGGMKLIRILPDGTPDGAFGMSGLVQLAPPGTDCSGGAVLFRSTTDSAGRVLVAGTCYSTTDDDGDGELDPDRFVVVRLYGDNGALDQDFGEQGFAFGTFSDSTASDGAYAVILDHSGRPLVSGYTTSPMGNVRQAALARLGYDLTFSDGFEAVPRGRLPGG